MASSLFGSESEVRKLLDSVSWFSCVGLPIDSSKYFIVDSWEKAFWYTDHEVTKWAAVEAGLLLYRQLSAHHDDRFVDWINIAKAAGEVTEKYVSSALSTPGIPTFPESAKDFLQGKIIGAFLEEAYDDVVEVMTCRAMLPVLQAGHFPCGWYCRAAEDFPDKSPIIVY